MTVIVDRPRGETRQGKTGQGKDMAMAMDMDMDMDMAIVDQIKKSDGIVWLWVMILDWA